MGTTVTTEKDFSKPIVRRKRMSARNDGSMRTVVDAGEFGTFTTDEPTQHGGGGGGPSPLQAVLGALCGCEAVTFHRTAAELGFVYEGIDFDADFTIDVRGRMGDRSVRPHFQRVRVEARVRTDESTERLAAVVEETEARCPVFNLIRDARVEVDMAWIQV